MSSHLSEITITEERQQLFSSVRYHPPAFGQGSSSSLFIHTPPSSKNTNKKRLKKIRSWSSKLKLKTSRKLPARKSLSIMYFLIYILIMYLLDYKSNWWLKTFFPTEHGPIIFWIYLISILAFQLGIASQCGKITYF